MRKRILSLLLIVSMLISLLAGCSSANPVVDPTGTGESASAIETEASATASTSELTTAPSETEATEESTEAPAETVMETTDAPTEPTETTPPETTPPETVPPTTQPPETEPAEEEGTRETPQRKAVNMLNYITVLTQEINASKGSRVFLDSVKSSLQNNLALSAIDRETQKQITNLWRTIDGYIMAAVKRERLEYIYEQSKAQSIREAIPNPLVVS